MRHSTPKQNHDFKVGQRIALSYPYGGSKPHLGQVIWVSSNSILIHMDGHQRAARFSIRNDRWRSEFGRSVRIELSAQPLLTSLTK